MYYKVTFTSLVLIFTYFQAPNAYSIGIEPVLYEMKQHDQAAVTKGSERKGFAKFWHWVKKKVQKHWVKFFYQENSKDGERLTGWWIALLGSLASIGIGTFLSASILKIILLPGGALGYLIINFGLAGTIHDLAKKKNLNKSLINWSWVIMILCGLALVWFAFYSGLAATRFDLIVGMAGFFGGFCSFLSLIALIF